MLTLPKEVKSELFRKISQQPNPFGDPDEEGHLKFLSNIWDLYSMPSQDDRYNDAYGDIYQHTVNNDDISIEHLFTQRLQLLDNDTYFNKFLETIVDPRFRKSPDEILFFVLLINEFLAPYNYQLGVVSFIEPSTPVYKLREKAYHDQPHDRKQNAIRFFVKDPSGRSDISRNHRPPPEFPAFVLAFNSGWNDYDTRSSYDLFYYNVNQSVAHFGGVKIISNGTEHSTEDVLPKDFTELPPAFCSLGQKMFYYERFKELLPTEFEHILFAFRDAIYNAHAYEKFERNTKFINSLCRNDSAERLLREVKYRLNGFDLYNLYKFQYRFRPPYATDDITVDFDFDHNADIPSRIYALIGKNGSGKTQLLTSLPRNLGGNADELFSPRKPMFSKIIAVSYSIFDQFEIPLRTATFNYVYCGLKTRTTTAMDFAALDQRFFTSITQIISAERINILRSILVHFIDAELLAALITINEIRQGDITKYELDTARYLTSRQALSSGQAILLSVITEIVAHIRYDSLLLYDEPETHLHPNAITELMNAIYDLVNKFESYCIIATHSPMVIRELFSKNVYVVQREENIPSVRRIGIESFGENIAVLTEEVFGNKEADKQYKKIIDVLIEKGNNAEQITSILESQGATLSLNTRLYISSAINNGSNPN